MAKRKNKKAAEKPSALTNITELCQFMGMMNQVNVYDKIGIFREMLDIYWYSCKKQSPSPPAPPPKIDSAMEIQSSIYHGSRILFLFLVKHTIF